MTNKNRRRRSNSKRSAFREEKRILDSIRAWFDQSIQDLKGRNDPSTGDPTVDMQLLRNKQNTIESFEAYRSQPYYGRIDYLDDASGKVKTAYIGNFNSRAIASRTRGLQVVVEPPNSSLTEVFDNPQGGQYIPARGAEPKPIRVLLKRAITIENGQLLDIEDVYEHNVVSGESKVDEHETLARVDSPVLVVQAAAGSGVDHLLRGRLDHLLSPFNNAHREPRPSADKVFIFGPTAPYIASVNRKLTEAVLNPVQVVAIGDWMAGQFRSRVSVRESDSILDCLMNGNEAFGLIEAHRFKGALEMMSLLDRFLDARRREIRTIAEEFVSCLPSDLASSKSAVTRAFRQNSEPNVARQVLVHEIAERWMNRNPNQEASDSEHKKRATATAEEALSFWPKLDTFTEYMSLVSRPSEIRTYSRGKVERDLAYKISLTVSSTRSRSLAPTDLAPVLYLDYKINGFTSEMFEHVVICEAQDMSPMELELIRLHSSNNRFTILGDLNQRLLPHRGLQSWNAVNNIFGRSNVQIHHMRLAHSATKQITRHNNRILKTTAPGVKKPTASGRSGRPRRKRFSNNGNEMRETLLKFLRNLLKLEGVDSIVILTKRHQSALALSNFLKSKGMEAIHYLARDGIVEKGVTLAPITLARGLEFDAVIVANVDEGNFSDTEFNRTLFYIACSRARHYLEIHMIGEEPEIVP